MSRLITTCFLVMAIYLLGNLGWASEKIGPAAAAQGASDTAVTAQETLTPAQKAQLDKAMALIQQGIKFSEEGVYWNSLMAIDQAHDLVEKTFGPDHLQTADIFHRMGRVYEQAYLWRFAIIVYKRALEIREKVLGPEHPDTAATMARLAGVYVTLGFFSQGLPLAQRSLQIREKILGPEHPATAESLAIQGVAYAQMGAQAQALSLTERAKNIREKVLGQEHVETAESLDDLAVLYAQLGLYDRALPLAQRAVKINETSRGVDHLQTAKSLKDLGLIFLALKDFSQAESCFRRAQSKRGGHSGRAEIKLGEQGLVELYLATGRFPQSLELLPAIAPLPTLTSRPQYLAQYYTQEGLTFKGMGRHEEAVTSFLKAIQATENLRDRAPGERTSFFEAGVFSGYFRAYRSLVALLAEMSLQNKGLPPALQNYGPDPAAVAFYFSESVKGRALLEAMVASPGRAVAPQIPPELASREKRLLEKFQKLEAEREAVFMPSFTGPKDRARFNDRLEILQKEQEDLLGELRRRTPRYAALNYPRPFKAQELPLKPGEVLLEYALGDKESYLLKVEPGGRTRVFRLALGQEALEKRLGALLAPFRQSVLKREDLHKFSLAEAAALYQELLAPALAGVNPGTRLIIVPDGILGAFPFEALVVQVGPDWAKSALVADRWPVTYYQSAAILALNRHLGVTRASQPLFALADCIYEKGSPRYLAYKAGQSKAGELRYTGQEKALTMAAITLKGVDLQFPPLPETRRTVEDLSSLFGVAPQPPQVLLDVLAIKSRLRQAPLEKYRYFFFGTHGFLASNLAGLQEPVLVLSQVETKSKDDGFLAFSEVMNLKLDADVVTLAACMTGVGQVMQGEGVLNFARAFQQAGARSVMVSLWNIPVDESMKFYTSFYKALKEGKSRSEALKVARQAVRAKEPHPYFWSGLILHGEG